MHDPIGQLIGHYRVLELIGKGGMGRVYRAEDVLLEREVALKLLPEHLLDDPGARARLLSEARAASKLDHRHLCTVFEVGEDRGYVFIAMALYKEGRDLAEVLKESGRLPVEEAVALARQIASGLAAAHREKIVHRDLKPSNVFLCEDGAGGAREVKILDFGVAKVEGVDLTQPGGTVGTVAYAAPEQQRGEADARSDLWALGVVLYEMLAGVCPFTGDYDVARLFAVLHLDPAPMRERRPEVPAAVEAVVMRLLQKDPADRFQRAEDVDAALADALDGGGTGAPPGPPRQSRRRRGVGWGATAGLLVLLAFTLLAFMLRGGLVGAPTLPEERHIAVLPFAVARADADGRVFADGLVEVVVSELAHLERYQGALQVVPTSEIRTQEIESASQARSAVGATLVVTGRVARDSARVTVTLNLEDATSLRQIDGVTLERPRASLDALRGDVVAALAQMLDVELRPEARAALAAGGTRSSAAFEAYVRGLGLLQGTAPDALGQAAAAFERAVEEDPRFALAHARLAEAAIRAYEDTREPAWVERAEAAVEQAVALNPNEPQGYLARARLYVTTGRYADAVRETRQALALNPGSEDAYGVLAAAYAAADDAGAAESAYREAIARNPGAWRGYNSLGKFYLNHGRAREALQAWQQVTQLAPDLAKGYNNLGAAYEALGRPDSAYAMFERAVALYPSSATLSNLGTMYYSDGRYADAVRTYRRALDLDEHNHVTWSGLAAAYERLGQRSEAVPAYREAIRRAEADRSVNPSDPVALTHLPNYYVSVGDSTRARTTAAAASALNPEGEDALYLGMAYEQLGERDEALRWITRALEGGVSPEEVESTHALFDLVRDPRYRRPLSSP